MTEFTLLQQMQESINDRGKMKAIFVCGTPGAGKSYTVNAITDGQMSPRIVNSDKMYEFLGRIGRTNIGDSTGWSNVRDTVRQTTQRQLALYINSLLPIFVDSTSANPSAVLRRKGILEAFGYDVGIVWVDTNLETALARAAQRERHVPEDYIRMTVERAAEAREFITAQFDWKVTINNGDGELTDKVIKTAYNATQSFFNAPISNPIGKRVLRQLEEAGERYLVPSQYSLEELNHLTAAWYKS